MSFSMILLESYMQDLHAWLVAVCRFTYTRKNAQVATDLQTSCNKSVHKLLTRCIRTACSEFVRTSLEQAVDKL